MTSPTNDISDAPYKRFLLYLSLTPEESSKLQPTDLEVSNVIFYVMGSSFRPAWIGVGDPPTRVVKLIASHHEKSVFFEIASDELLSLRSDEFLERVREQLLKL